MRVLATILCFSCGNLLGQTNENHFNSWFTLNSKSNISKSFFFKSQTSIRRLDGIQNWQQFLVRPYLSYKRSESIEYSIGYTFIKNWHYGNQITTFDLPEDNLWQQVQLSCNLGKLTVKNRYRQEERFIGYDYSKSEHHYNYKYRNRFRYRLTIKLPVSERMSIALYNELFLNQTNNLLPVAFNQNWLGISSSWSISEAIKANLGYMMQYLDRGTHYEQNHTLTFSINVTTPNLTGK